MGMASADVVVIGFGVAGLTAAITAHDRGAEVVILEKMDEPHSGGNSRVSGSVWFSPSDGEAAARHLRALSGPFALPEGLVAAWAREVPQNTAWVESLGIQVRTSPSEPEFPELEGHECDDAINHVEPSWGYSRLWLALREAARERGIQVRFECRAEAMLQDGDQATVVGVQLAGGETIRARRAVVLATGGFAANEEMARDFLRLPGATPWGSPGSTGDGLRMAQKAGAGLWHLSNFMGVPGLAAPHLRCGFRVMFPHSQGWILADEEGRRFLNENQRPRHGKIISGGRLRPFPDRRYHCVFDEVTRCAGPIVNLPEDEPFSWNAIVEGYRWSADNQVEIDRGWIAKGSTPAELARAIGVDAANLEATINRYNDACASGRDPDFGRKPQTLSPIREPPFYAYTWGPLVAFTLGGPRKNARAQVLDPFGDPIPRLFCAGEVSSTYSWGFIGGHMLADAMAFGRIAGGEAAACPG